MKKAVVGALVALFAASLLSLFALDYYYYWHRPRQPDVAAGRIYAQNVKIDGAVARVYLTRFESFPYRYGQLFMMVFFGGALILGSRWDVLPRRAEPQKKFY